MAKRQRSISLSFALLRFAIVMLGCMLLCFLAWYIVMVRFQHTGVTYHGSLSNQQVEQMLAGEPKAFLPPGDDFLPEYALFDPNGQVLESNVKGKKLKTLYAFFRENTGDIDILQHTYVDGSTIILRWYYRAEFTNPTLLKLLPPAEYLGLVTLAVALVLCLLLNTLWLRRYLADKLKLFSWVSEKVGSQELDFDIPHAGIREYDQALDAMEHMREALYSALSSQWTAQQKREEEIAALAHDLKNPLTLVGGNAELLLEEELPGGIRKMVETIVASNDRAKQYVASLLEASTSIEEAFESTSLNILFDELCQSIMFIAEAKGVYMQTQNSLRGTVYIQKDHLLRALSNVVQNAIEHTPAGRNVYLEGTMIEGGWQVTVRDEGSGFSKAALHHGTERLWRGDPARGADGHNGLGLWFASEVTKTHAGQLELRNCDSGGLVTVNLGKTSPI
ncbi:MAG: HAMP domain-containing sensor histidine kinase [Cellulosilyticaceae bacterium]